MPRINPDKAQSIKDFDDKLEWVENNPVRDEDTAARAIVDELMRAVEPLGPGEACTDSDVVQLRKLYAEPTREYGSLPVIAEEE